MANKASWVFGTTDMGGYVKCSKCGKKYSTLRFIFADEDTTTCPECGSEMSFDSLDIDLIKQEALNER